MKTMKVRLLAVSLTLAGISNQSHAQKSIQLSNYTKSTVLAANEVIYEKVSANANVKTTVDIKNTSNSTKSYIAKRYDMVLNADPTTTAQAYFCMAGNCYIPQTMISPTALTLTALQSASEIPGAFEMLIADLDEASTKGYSYVKYTFQNTSDPIDSIQISIKYNDPNAPVGISSHSKDEFSLQVSPVPAKEFVTIRSSEITADGNITLINSVGQMIYSSSFSPNEFKDGVNITIPENASGIYYLMLSSQGMTVTRKVVVE